MSDGRPASGHLRIATVGFQGFGNVGDEAILTGIEALMHGSEATVTTVFSGPRPETVAAFPAARRVVTRRHLPTPTAWRALRDVDVLLLAGGGLLNDHWGWVVPRYVGWTLIARLAGARVAWVGVGVGPLRRRPLRWLTRLGARLASPVLVRDEESRKLLAGAGRPRVIPDPSVFNERPRRIDGHAIGLVVRAPAPDDMDAEPGLIAAIIGLADELQVRGSEVVLLSMGAGADEAFLARLTAGFAGHGRPAPPVEALGPGPAEALDTLAGFGTLVVVRLHGLLLGLLAGVPVIPIAYDAKVRAAADRLGLAELTVPLRAVDARTLLDRLDAARAPELRALTKRHLEAMRDEGPSIARAILRPWKNR